MFEIPDGVDYVAAATYAEDGRFLAATALAALPADRKLDALLPAAGGELSRIVVIGYAAAALEGYTISDARLEPKQFELAALPRPTYAAAAAPGDTSAVMLDDPPELTAPWVDACPDLSALSARFDCVINNCRPAIVQNGCVLEISPLCTEGLYSVQLTPQLEVIAVESDRHQVCEVIDPPEDAAVAFRCTDVESDACVVDLSQPLPPRLEVESFMLFTPAEATEALEYYFAGGVAFDDRAVIVTFGDRPQPRECAPVEPGRFYFLEVASGMVSGSIEAPRCTAFPRKLGDGFVALFGSGPRSLGWFGPDGVLNDSVVIDGLGIVQDVAIDEQRAYVLEAAVVGALTRLVVFGLESRTIERVLELSADEYSSVAVGDGSVVVIDDEADNAEIFEIGTWMRRGNVSLQVGLLAAELNRVEYHAPSSRFVVAVGSAQAGLSFFDDATVEASRVVSFEEMDFEPIDLAPWLARPGYWLVALSNRHEGDDAVFGVLDPAGRYLLPGLVRVPEVGMPWFVVPAASKTVVLSRYSTRVFLLSPSR